MASVDDLRAVLALSFVKGFGPVKFLRLLEQCGNLAGALRRMRPRMEDLCFEKADREIRLARQNGVEILSLLDIRYPALLREIHDPPMRLYVKGRLPEDAFPKVAVVGARQASSYGLETARRLAGELAYSGVVVVSGMALGIDSAAHEGALSAGGNTLAVLGGGLSRIYPATNIKLSKAIERAGALLSEYPMEERPRPEYFPMRNRIISGLSRAVVVVEAREKSGALITADAALEQGRDVFAVPGNVNASRSSGTNALIKEGAAPASRASDILEALSLVPKKNRASGVLQSKKTAKGLNVQETKCLSLLDEGECVHVDELVEKSGLSASEAIAALSVLEIKGHIRQMPGKYFQSLGALHGSRT